MGSGWGRDEDVRCDSERSGKLWGGRTLLSVLSVFLSVLSSFLWSRCGVFLRVITVYVSAWHKRENVDNLTHCEGVWPCGVAYFGAQPGCPGGGRCPPVSVHRSRLLWASELESCLVSVAGGRAAMTDLLGLSTERKHM